MCALQPEVPAVVLFNCKREKVKAFCTVAIGTILHDACLGKLPVVVIGMAVGATCVTDLCRDAGLVAFLAGNVLVFVCKRKGGL